MARQRPLHITVLLLLLMTASLTLGQPAMAAPGDITLASTSDEEVKGDSFSGDSSVSADGTVVAFDSIATNLDPGDTDSTGDTYVKNVATGDITLASTSDAGVKGNGDSGGANNVEPSLSADGTKVAFTSAATNLDPGDTDTNTDVYVKEVATGNIILASTSDAGVKGNDGGFGPLQPSLSTDGTKVAFISGATNLGEGETDGFTQVYVKNLTTGDLTLASSSDTGVKSNSGSAWPSLSGDGTKVAFYSSSTNLGGGFRSNVYVKDLTTGDLTLASTSDAGVEGNAESVEPFLSADGTKVAFKSTATNLDAGDTDAGVDVYVKDLVTEDITLASTSDAGVKGDSTSDEPSLSADGARVAFRSQASNLDPAATAGCCDIYVKDLATGDITLASTSDTGANVAGADQEPSLSADGNEVAFQSTAVFDPADSGGGDDVYVKELGTGGGRADSAISIQHRVRPHRLTGRVSSPDDSCEPGRRVVLKRRKAGSDPTIGSDRTDGQGRYSIRHRGTRRARTYYTRIGTNADCRGAQSRNLRAR